MSAVTEAQETAAVDLGALLDAGDGAVVTLEARETRLMAHKAVLVARSPVFAAMLCHDTLEASSGRVEIPDVEGAVLRQLLSYCYSLRAPQLPAMATQLLVAADKYGLAALKAACEQQVAAQLDVENAAASAVLAVRHSCPDLTAIAIAFIKAHNYQVMATPGWAEAMKNQPDDLIQVSQLLADPPAETRMPAAGGGRTTRQPGRDHSQTRASAAPPTTVRDNPPADGATFCRFWNLSEEDKCKQLLLAALCGPEGDLRALLAAGADVMARDEARRTALHKAAAAGSVDAVKLLVEAGAQVDARNSDGNVPLHVAAINGRTGVVRLLLASSADANARNSWQKTPLHYAAQRGHTQVVAALLEGGADVAARCCNGLSPLDIARQYNHQDVIDLLT